MSSLQDRVSVPTNSEFVANILALSSDRFTPAIDATSLMSSSSLERRGTDYFCRTRKPQLTKAVPTQRRQASGRELQEAPGSPSSYTVLSSDGVGSGQD